MEIWKLEIRKADNGYILKGKFENSEIITEEVIEEKDGKELESMRNVLWDVMNYFGIYYSKHNEKNIKIIIENKDGKEIIEE